jgi:hypothetical protein
MDAISVMLFDRTACRRARQTGTDGGAITLLPFLLIAVIS